MKFRFQSATGIIVFLISYLVRIHRIEKGNFVTWDEAHFGKYSHKYLSRIFYFDVHPPLGKMLTALAGLIAGQPPDFDFSTADKFPETFDYAGMRRLHAIIASFTPLFGYLIMREFGTSLSMATILSSLFIFENGSISIGRLVLLDSHLLTFTAATIYFFIRLFTRGTPIRVVDENNDTERSHDNLMDNQSRIVHLRVDNEEPINDGDNNENNTNSTTVHNKIKVTQKLQKLFTVENTWDLLALGTLIGCVMSIKWIGILTTLLVGLYIAIDLFFRLKNLSLRHTLTCFFKRALFLILIPTAIYMSLFWIHLKIVYKSGPDDTFMSPDFQSTLEGGATTGIKRFVSYGKQITIMGQKGHLHSHMHTYPGNKLEDGAPLQVTMYEPRDSNNKMFFQRITDEESPGFLKNGDEVAILHMETNSYLEQGPEYTPEGAYEELPWKPRRAQMVRDGISEDAVWIVESSGIIETLSTSFALKNAESGWYLCWMERKYPEWGHNQWEVGVVPKKTPNCQFTISENYFSNGETNESIKYGFLSSLIELHKVMFKINASFIQDPNLEPDKIVSEPWEWPLLTRGLRMSQWHAHEKFYMFMNPVILYGSTLGLLISPLVWVIIKIRNSRARIKETSVIYGPGPLFVAIGGWIAHYLPFFLVGRVLYMHHYFPALFFATLNLAFLLRMIRPWIVASFVILSILVYTAYSPLTYGFIDQEAVRKLQLIRSWDFVDNSMKGKKSGILFTCFTKI